MLETLALPPCLNILPRHIILYATLDHLHKDCHDDNSSTFNIHYICCSREVHLAWFSFFSRYDAMQCNSERPDLTWSRSWRGLTSSIKPLRLWHIKFRPQITLSITNEHIYVCPTMYVCVYPRCIGTLYGGTYKTAVGSGAVRMQTLKVCCRQFVRIYNVFHSFLISFFCIVESLLFSFFLLVSLLQYC